MAALLAALARREHPPGTGRAAPSRAPSTELDQVQADLDQPRRGARRPSCSSAHRRVRAAVGAIRRGLRSRPAGTPTCSACTSTCRPAGRRCPVTQLTEHTAASGSRAAARPPTCCSASPPAAATSRQRPTTTTSRPANARRGRQPQVGLPPRRLPRVPRPPGPAARDDPATSETRERWLLLLLASSASAGCPYARGGITADDRHYPVSHLWEHRARSPARLGRPISTSAPAEPGNRPAPQSMLQEFLNAAMPTCGGILSNGRLLRLLRDSTALIGSAYVEFDLESIFDGELLQRLRPALRARPRVPLRAARRTTMLPPSVATAGWNAGASSSNEDGTRARDRLRDGVEQALNALGTGFPRREPAGIAGPGPGTQLLNRRPAARTAAPGLPAGLLVRRRGPRSCSTTPRMSAAIDNYHGTSPPAGSARSPGAAPGDRHTDLWRTLVVVLDCPRQPKAASRSSACPASVALLPALTQNGDQALASPTCCGLRTAERPTC